MSRAAWFYRRGPLLVALASLGAGTDFARAADFNPEGRKRLPAAAPVAPKQPQQPKAAAPAAPVAEDTPAVLMRRYLDLLTREPGAEFPLERLAQLYRERDGNLHALIAQFEADAAKEGAAGRAAKLSLAGVLVHAGDSAKAEALYEAVLAADANNEPAARRLAALLAARGDPRTARERLAATLKLRLPDAVHEQNLRKLIDWSLDLSDVAAAQSYHAELTRRAGGSFFVRAELGRLLFDRRLFEAAEAEYRRLVESARGDARTLGPALCDHGRALSALGKHTEALQVLAEAERATSAGSGSRLEVLKLMVDAHRAADRLPELVERLAREGGRDFDRLVLLAQLYAEVGQVDRARQTYESALALRPRAVEARLEVVRLLQLSGELDRVIDHYRQLIRAAPQNPDYGFRLAEAHLQRGEQAEARRVLTELEARSRGDEDTLAALVDFYERVGEGARALELLERLAKGDGERNLIELGDRYYGRGDTERALETWQRLARDPNDAAALHALGEVYLDHDMPDQALECFARAVKLAPDRVEYSKSHALALERAGASASNNQTRARYQRQAQELWEQLLARATRARDALLAREARQHIVTLWSLGGTLGERVTKLRRRFEVEPPDLEAGRLLAETELRLRRHADAEKTLRAVIREAPGDIESHQRLERAVWQQGNLDGAIAVLERLTEIDPQRAKEYYQRMASYAAEGYQDDRAITYAARAVQLSPDDAQGHQRLGEMYRERQDVGRAIAEFRQALSKNDRLFPVHLQLAELLLKEQDMAGADQLLGQVMRACPDEQLIARATRLRLQLHLGDNTLEVLERDLLPLALGHPGRPIYRRLLIEVYGTLAFPLVSQEKSADAEARAQAETALTRLGQRAVKPLLDALGDAHEAEQRIAIELLGHIRNASAGPALVTFAAGQAAPELRLRAMVAAGALGDVSLLDKFEAAAFRDGASGSDPVGVAAAWAIAKLGSSRARPALTRLLSRPAPTLQAIAVLGFSRLEGRRDPALFARVVGSPEYGLLARAAAAFALGELGERRALPAIVALSGASDPSVRMAATLSLARLGAPEARSLIAGALLSGEAELVAAGVRAACVLSGKASSSAAQALGVPEGRVDARVLLEQLEVSRCSPDAEAAALSLLGADLARAAVQALHGSRTETLAVAGALLDANGKATFEPLGRHLAEADATLGKHAREAIEQIAVAVFEPYRELADHPSAELRQTALRWLATRPEPRAVERVLSALGDADPAVQHTALSGLEKRPDAIVTRALAELLGRAPSWSLRRQAAEILGKSGPAGAADAVLAALRQAALSDDYALVREAAARALFSLSPQAATSVLERLARSDPEAQVQRTARDLLDNEKP